MVFRCGLNVRSCHTTCLKGRWMIADIDSFLALETNTAVNARFPDPPRQVALGGGGLEAGKAMTASQLQEVGLLRKCHTR
eukprot:270985-Prorocentrum_minimum.AAC.2